MTTAQDIFACPNGKLSQFVEFQKLPVAAFSSYQYASLWQSVGGPGGAGSAPTSGKANGRVCTKSTVGALPFLDAPNGKSLYLKGINFTGVGQEPCHVVIVDRLAEIQILLAEATGSFTGCDASSKLASTAGRGDGGIILAEAFGGALGTATNFSLGYTNQNGTGSRSTGTLTSVASCVRGCNLFAAQGLAIPLQSGDWGVRSLDSVTAVSGSGTGNVLFTIAKVVGEFSAYAASQNYERDFYMELPIMQKLRNDACLSVLICGNGTVSTSIPFVGTLEVVAL